MIAAIVPAAGRSERMGRPKLTLPVGKTTVIERVITALRAGGADVVVVVVPPPDARGAAALADEAQRAGAAIVVPDQRPADMRASVELGLDYLSRAVPPQSVLIAPGDSVGITVPLVAQVVARSRAEPRSIIVPTFQGRRGHPIAFPWGLSTEIRGLPPGVGINAIVVLRSALVIELDVTEAGTVADLNEPADYQWWAEKMKLE